MSPPGAEFGTAGCGTLTGLTVLLACSHNRGGGDLPKRKDEWMGRWAGDRIVILGDDSHKDDLPQLSDQEFKEAINAVWGDRTKKTSWRDISDGVRACICVDPYVRQAQNARR